MWEGKGVVKRKFGEIGIFLGRGYFGAEKWVGGENLRAEKCGGGHARCPRVNHCFL